MKKILVMMFILIMSMGIGVKAYAVNGYRNERTGTEYETLPQAIAGANAGDTITLLREISGAPDIEGAAATVNKNLTLNLQGFLMQKESNSITVNSGCTLTITGTSSGRITGGTGCHTIVNNGTINVENVCIRNWAGTDSYQAIKNNKGATINLKSGMISAKGCAVANYGTVNMSGGVMEATIDDSTNFDSIYTKAIRQYPGGVLKMSAGIIRATNRKNRARGINDNGGIIEITGGEVIATGPEPTGIIIDDPSAMVSKITIKKGSSTPKITATGGRGIQISDHIKADVTIEDVVINAAEGIGLYDYASGNMTITGGKIIGTTCGIYKRWDVTTTLTLGSNSNVLNKTDPEVRGGNYAIDYSPNSFNFYNGVMKGTNSKPYTGGPVIRTGKYTMVTEGPSGGLYSVYTKTSDTTAPTGTANIPAYTNTGNVSVTASAADESGGTGIAEVRYAVWSEVNSQDDLVWYSTTASNYAYTVDLKKHAPGTEGVYNIHCYAYDKAGNKTLIGGKQVIYDKTVPYSTATQKLEIKNLSASGYDVYAYGIVDAGGSGINRVQFPTWTDLNGQDDAFPNWPENASYTGTKQADGTTWVYRVNVSDHNNELGLYHTHVYAYDNAGNSQMIEGTTALVIDDVTPPTCSGYTPTGTFYTNDTNYTFTAKLTATDNESGMDYVNFQGWYGGETYVSNYNVNGVTSASNNVYQYTWSGLSSIKNTTTGAINNGEGIYMYDAWAYDKVGLRTWSGGKTKVIYDKTAPTITGASKMNLGESTSLILTDNLSGVSAWQVTNLDTGVTSAWKEITASTNTSLTFTPEQAGTLQIRIKDSAGNTNTKTIVVYEVIDETAVINGNVKIVGKNQAGVTLTAQTNITPKNCELTYQWFTNTTNSTTGGTAIAGATTSTYIVKENDVGKYIYVEVTANYYGE